MVVNCILTSFTYFFPLFSDQNLLISWFLIAMIGVYAQWKQNKGRAPFPPPPASPRLVTERSPLLGAIYA